MNYATKFMLAHMRYHWKALEMQILMMSFPSLCNLQARSNRRFKLTNQLQDFRCVTMAREDVMLMSLLSGIRTKCVYNIFKMATTQQDAHAKACDFDNYRALSLREKRPQGPGKITCRRFKGDQKIDDYVSEPHFVFIGQDVVSCSNEDGEGDDYEIKLWFTGGYLPGNENIIVEESKNLLELVIVITQADIKIWRTEKLSVSFPACLELTDCIQWGKKEFSVFGYHDA